jgi:hypothetical protein
MLTVARSPAGAVVITASPLPVAVLLATPIAVSVTSPFELLVAPPPRLRVAGLPPTAVAKLTSASEARTPWSVIRVEIRIERFFERGIVVAVSPAHPVILVRRKVEEWSAEKTEETNNDAPTIDVSRWDRGAASTFLNDSREPYAQPHAASLN